MYITVILGETFEKGDKESQAIPEDSPPYVDVIVNPDCPIRMVYDYIREKFKIPPEVEFDLCDGLGNLVFLYDVEPWENGTNYLKPKTTYFVVLFDRDENNRPINPVLNVPKKFLNRSSDCDNMKLKIDKQMARARR